MKQDLRRGLARLAELGRLRPYPQVQAEGIDFCSNDYLGLASDPEVIEAGRAALAEHGAGGKASRLLAGGCALHVMVEREAARWLSSEAALLFATGYQANVGLLSALGRAGDVILSDQLNHASLIDGARLSRARVEVYAHADLGDLERRLERAGSAGRRLVVSESIFSMDGDAAPITELADLCERHDAWLVLDEAHAVGLLGPEGRGLAPVEHPRLLARMVGAGKALGVAGGLVLCGEELRDHLVNHARSFIFSTAPTPAMAGSLLCAMQRCQQMDRERDRVLDMARALAQGLDLPVPDAAIVPFPLGADHHAVEVAEMLQAEGYHLRAVRPPTVPEGSARLRLVLHAYNLPQEIDALCQRLASLEVIPEKKTTAKLAAVLFVVGTDTGVGKTVVSAALLRAWRRRSAARYWKPVQTGDENDRARVAELAGVDDCDLPEPVWSLPLPASPHQAAAAVGVTIDTDLLRSHLQELRQQRGPLLVELAGGLLVPYGLDGLGLRTQADWLAIERPPLVLVARSGLGTLNHTLLSLEALRARRLEPRALVLVGPRHPENRAALEALAGVGCILEMPELAPLDTASLDLWLDQQDLDPIFGEGS